MPNSIKNKDDASDDEYYNYTKYTQSDAILFNRNRKHNRLNYCEAPRIKGFLSFIVDKMPSIPENEILDDSENFRPTK